MTTQHLARAGTAAHRTHGVPHGPVGVRRQGRRSGPVVVERDKRRSRQGRDQPTHPVERWVAGMGKILLCARPTVHIVAGRLVGRIARGQLTDLHPQVLRTTLPHPVGGSRRPHKVARHRENRRRVRRQAVAHRHQGPGGNQSGRTGDRPRGDEIVKLLAVAVRPARLHAAGTVVPHAIVRKVDALTVGRIGRCHRVQQLTHQHRRPVRRGDVGIGIGGIHRGNHRGKRSRRGGRDMPTEPLGHHTLHPVHIEPERVRHLAAQHRTHAPAEPRVEVILRADRKL